METGGRCSGGRVNRFHGRSLVFELFRSPEMKRVNSGNSLTRPHMFQSVSLYKQDSCYVVCVLMLHSA